MPRQARAERTRERLLDAAFELFARKGSLETTFDAISEAAGVSRGSIRFHFGSKEGLLFAVVDRVFAEWENEVMTPLLLEGNGPTSIGPAVAAHAEMSRKNEAAGRLFFVLLFEALGPRPELRSRFAALYERLRRFCRSWIEAAQANGSVARTVDADAVSAMILGALGGIHYQWHLDPERIDLDHVRRVLIEVLDRGLAPTPGAVD